MGTYFCCPPKSPDIGSTDLESWERKHFIATENLVACPGGLSQYQLQVFIPNGLQGRFK